MTENLSQLNAPVLIIRSHLNSGHYDLNLIKKYFVTKIAQPGNVKVANKQNKVMYMCTPMFRFLDICNYVSPWDKL